MESNLSVIFREKHIAAILITTQIHKQYSLIFTDSNLFVLIVTDFYWF